MQAQAIVPLLVKRLLLRLQTATLKSSNNRNKHWYLNNRLPSLSYSPVIVHIVAIVRIAHTAAIVHTALIVHTIRVDKEFGKIRMGVDFSAPFFLFGYKALNLSQINAFNYGGDNTKIEDGFN